MDSMKKHEMHSDSFSPLFISENCDTLAETAPGTTFEMAVDTTVVFRDEFEDVFDTMLNADVWESENERRQYRERAERLLNFYRSDSAELSMAQFDLKNWRELTWEDVFDPSAGMRSSNYEKEHVQSSGVSDTTYQLYASAESKLERNKREKALLEKDVLEWKKRVDADLNLLNLLQGNTKTVAQYLWYETAERTMEDIAEELAVGKTSVWREKDKAIETIALFLKRMDYRKIRALFQ